MFARRQYGTQRGRGWKREWIGTRGARRATWTMWTLHETLAWPQLGVQGPESLRPDTSIRIEYSDENERAHSGIYDTLQMITRNVSSL